jgi:hypothetical protein
MWVGAHGCRAGAAAGGGPLAGCVRGKKRWISVRCRRRRRGLQDTATRLTPSCSIVVPAEQILGSTRTRTHPAIGDPPRHLPSSA